MIKMVLSPDFTATDKSANVLSYLYFDVHGRYNLMELVQTLYVTGADGVRGILQGGQTPKLYILMEQRCVLSHTCAAFFFFFFFFY